jgi:phosphatidylglycerol:prolipoprotein diacylglycerol transferase
MIPYPNINPVAWKIGPINIHWYGVMYLIGFIAAWSLALYRAKKPHYHSSWTSETIADLIFYAALGVVVGGRLGYMLFYDFPTLIHSPLSLLKIWQGGMSFHGGLLGVVIALWVYSRRVNMSFFQVTDFITPMVPIGLAAGRMGNFINGYLFGRITDVPWAMVFPNGGPFPRHPSPLYEFFLEGIVLFIILWWFSAKKRPTMAISALFLILYGVFRIFCECFRQPDPQLGFIAFGWLTMGQLLSIPMVLIGLILLYCSYRHIFTIR